MQKDRLILTILSRPVSGYMVWDILKGHFAVLRITIVICLCLLPGCAKVPPELTNDNPVYITLFVGDQTPTIKTSPTIVGTETPFTLCSPLADIKLSELDKFISNPFNPSLIPDARDTGHHGVDFAYYTHPDTGKVMLGSPIDAMLAGRVASISGGMMPYGNLTIIETPLNRLSKDLKTIFTGYPQPTPMVPETHLTCPDTADIKSGWNFNQQSVYTLYAHMDKAPEVKVNEQVACGQKIGVVGTSGRSVNPHLHLEIRIGPGGATFPSMAHYTDAATTEEMSVYCTWRVSGLFQAIDPVKFIRSSY